jgi:hypothetical protein
MDEMRLIRSLLDEAPPSAEVVAEGRQRLTSGRVKKVKRPRWAGFTVIAAAATAAVVAIATVTQTPQPTQKQKPVPMTARQVLLTAADKAAAMPVGRYWHTHVISSEGYHIAHGDYMIFGARHEIDQWVASRSDKDSDVFRSRFAAAVPQTPDDRAAWKRAGSPSHWTVRSNGDDIPQSGTSEKWDLTTSTPADKREMERLRERVHKDCLKRKKCLEPPGPPTAKQRDALARDPRALRRYLLTSTYGAPSEILRAAGELLLMPSTPALRSAVFRVLADERGVRGLGTARDPLNRPAIILAIRATEDGNVFDNELLLDPVTYVPLGIQTVLVKGNGGKHVPPAPGQLSSGLETKGMKPGAITHSEIYVEMGWTNTVYGG